MTYQKCDVCGKLAHTRAACSAYDAMSYAYCEDCLHKRLEPYEAVVDYISCAGHFPHDIREEYVRDVHRMLHIWGRTEEEFIRDVDNAIERYNEMCKYL